MSRQSAASRPFSVSAPRSSCRLISATRSAPNSPASCWASEPTICARRHPDHRLLAPWSPNADGELNACPVFGDRPSPWLTIWQGRLRAVTTLARRLGLTPAGRQPFKSVEDRQDAGLKEGLNQPRCSTLVVINWAGA